jgi:hypothetical protein
MSENADDTVRAHFHGKCLLQATDYVLNILDGLRSELGKELSKDAFKIEALANHSEDPINRYVKQYGNEGKYLGLMSFSSIVDVNRGKPIMYSELGRTIDSVVSGPLGIDDQRRPAIIIPTEKEQVMLHGGFTDGMLEFLTALKMHELALERIAPLLSLYTKKPEQPAVPHYCSIDYDPAKATLSFGYQRKDPSADMSMDNAAFLLKIG